jgi:hypothetical protein
MATFNVTGYAKSGQIQVTSTVVGLEKAIAAAEAFGRRTAIELGGALFREAESIMADSKLEVPVDTGALRSTGHVELPRRENSEIVVECGYGGPATPYALRQHEELEFRHRVGKAKYLSDPFNRHTKGMDERLAADIRSRMAA